MKNEYDNNHKYKADMPFDFINDKVYLYIANFYHMNIYIATDLRLF